MALICGSWALAGDVRTLIFDSGALRGDAREALIDVPGAVFEAPGAVFEPPAAVFAAGAAKSDVGCGGYENGDQDQHRGELRGQVVDFALSHSSSTAHRDLPPES